MFQVPFLIFICRQAPNQKDVECFSPHCVLFQFALCRVGPDWNIINRLTWNETYGDNQDFSITLSLPDYGYILVWAMKCLYASLFCDFYDMFPIPASSRPYFDIPQTGTYYSYERK